MMLVWCLVWWWFDVSVILVYREADVGFGV